MYIQVFLVINPGPHSENCIMVRPNVGRYTQKKNKVRYDQLPLWRAEGHVNRALEVWERE